ncbi:hypothetical protein [Falsiroseomonas sp.]|uniref:hypothetical protein n=1 Tax=Falsiroseomonas sp. TaxID=2870721 RepID=UPI0034A2F965
MTATRYIYLAQTSTAEVYRGFNKRAAIKAAGAAAQQTGEMVDVTKFLASADGQKVFSNIGRVSTRFPR